MFSKRWCCFFGLLAAIASLYVVSFSWIAIAGETPKRGASKPTQNSILSNEVDFGGKVLAIRMSNSSQTLAIEQVVLRKLGDELFLTGKAVDIGNRNWPTGTNVWCSIKQITQIAEFRNVREIQKNLPPDFTRTMEVVPYVTPPRPSHPRSKDQSEQ